MSCRSLTPLQITPPLDKGGQGWGVESWVRRDWIRHSFAREPVPPLLANDLPPLIREGKGGWRDRTNYKASRLGSIAVRVHSLFAPPALAPCCGSLEECRARVRVRSLSMPSPLARPYQGGEQWRNQGQLSPSQFLAPVLALGLLIVCSRSALAGPLSQQSSPDAAKRVVIPFDFESKFDNGEYGQNIGDIFWSKLKRQGGFILPESMQEVRDWCQRNGLVPSPDTTLERMKEIVVKEQAGDIGIWGKVERVPGFETDVYDLSINIADFTVDPPRMIYQKTARSRTVGEIPHIYVKEALDRLYGRTPSIATGPDPNREARWEKAPNLVNGDFEQGGSTPLNWDKLPHDVSWVWEKARSAKTRNRVIRFTMNDDVAGTTGVLYYSKFFPVEEGARYRFRWRWKTTGSAAKVFVKCYDELPTEFRTSSAVDPTQMEKREVYRSQQNLQGNVGVWNVQTEEFTPEHTQFTPRWGRVMLYACWPAGIVDWDDVVVKQIAPRPAGRGKKDRRPSMETKVRSSEIEERDRTLRPRYNVPLKDE